MTPDELRAKWERGHPADVATREDQAWFWTPEWQAMEREADEAIAAGQVERFLTTADFLASLDEPDGSY